MCLLVVMEYLVFWESNSKGGPLLAAPALKVVSEAIAKKGTRNKQQSK
jgi:hypothetical protein